MIRILVVFVTAVLVGCAAVTPLESVYVPAQHQGWKFGSGNNKPGTTLAEFIPENESISNWSRLFTIQFLEGTHETPQSVMGKLQSEMLARCPNATWKVFTQDTSSVTYQWGISNCPGQSDQIEVARLLQGNDGVHRIAFTRKGEQFQPGERESWLSAFSNAYVVKDGKRVVVAP